MKPVFASQVRLYPWRQGFELLMIHFGMVMAETLYYTGSTTKSFTAAALTLLRDRAPRPLTLSS